MKKSIACAAFLTLAMTQGAYAEESSGGDEAKNKPTECVAVELWTVSGKSINRGDEPKHTVKIPEGWTLVGGSGGGGHPTIVICR